MNTTAMLIAALVVLPAVGLVTLVSLAMVHVDAELHSFCRFQWRHLET